MTTRNASVLYRKLQRTAKLVFQDDKRALSAAKVRLRNEFHKYSGEKDIHKIRDLLKLGEEVNEVLLKDVLQFRPTASGNLRANFNRQHLMRKFLSMEEAMEHHKEICDGNH